jgi:hypothetical protein
MAVMPENQGEGIRGVAFVVHDEDRKGEGLGIHDRSSFRARYSPYPPWKSRTSLHGLLASVNSFSKVSPACDSDAIPSHLLNRPHI